ncbi:MAG: hypothetical protein JNK57_13040 [Planctomycetaceae bacterium]|nr:hypothetical protein [Planctomycetaceae bacterium]
MAVFVIFVEGADTEPKKIPVYFVEHEEHASLICEGMKESEYQIFDFSYHQCTRADRGKFAVWAEMKIGVQSGVYGSIAAGIYELIDGAYATISQRRSSGNPDSASGSETGKDDSTTQSEGVAVETNEGRKRLTELASTQTLNPEGSVETDDKLPKQLRKDSPSRVKAKSAYDYAMERIPNANVMTVAELFNAITEDGEAKEMLPPTAESFTKYLNDCGIRLKKSGSKTAGSSVVRQSDL